MAVMPPRVGKILYAALFALALPALLVVWAHATADVVGLPAPYAPLSGAALALAGLAVMVKGMVDLWRYGGGLPMSPYPPPRLVSRGIYCYLAHPIYTGFCAACAGASLAAGSASGLWLVTPAVILGCAALVAGYELPGLRNRFGGQLAQPLIRMAPDEPGAPTAAARLSACVLVLIPWAILYTALSRMGAQPGAVSTYFPFETKWPVWEWAEVVYASTYPFVVAAPLVAASSRDLRNFSLRGLMTMAVNFPLFLTLPLVAEHRPFVSSTLPGRLLQWERALDTPAAAFPSFHVTWAWVAAEVYVQRWPRLRLVWRGWAVMISLACIAVGMHSIADVAAGLGVVWLVFRAGWVWERMRAAAERVANSWREWNRGGIRSINHGMYGGVAAFAGVLIAGLAAGPGSTPAIALAASLSLAGAALWAQIIEGSPRLLRPYGFYGGVLGIVVAAFFAPWAGTDSWLLLGAYSVAAPWIQSIGRLRCLVQGCCHGRPAPPDVGIRYFHPRSRVYRLSEYAGVPLHPTPLYSILWNVLLAMVLTRLWALHVALALVIGAYLILSGLGRFVEESYRGEPQTLVFGGLRLYQWMAILSVVSGAVLTAAGSRTPAPQFFFHGGVVLPAAAFGLVCWFAMGVDFPRSNRRFARLVS